MTGVAILLRAHLRRDRWMLLWWIAGVVVLYVSTAASVSDLYVTPAELAAAGRALGTNPAFVAMAGPPRALDTLGGQVTWQTTAFGALTVGLMTMFLVGRHTRAEEESGREELTRAAVVGRTAPPVAAGAVAVLAGLVAGLLVGGVLAALPGLAPADSWALGLGLACVGCFHTAVALLAVQLAGSTRGAYGLAGAVLAASFVLRAVGDVQRSWVVWASPTGWYQAMHPYSGLRWWPAGLLLLAAAMVTALALAVLGRRDLGAGALPARRGPAYAGRSLGSALGLAWRQQRGTVLAWGLGLFLVGLSYGAIGTDVGTLIGDGSASRELLVQRGGGLVDGFYATAGLVLALLACGFAVSSALRAASAEADGHAELLLATALSRARWLGAQAVLTVGGTAAVLAAASIGTAVGFALTSGDVGRAVGLAGGPLAVLPGVLVLVGLAHLVHGLLPRRPALAWLPLALVAALVVLGPLLRLPGWLLALSPFEHLALVPAQPVRWLPWIAVLAVAAAAGAAGAYAATRRDLV